MSLLSFAAIIFSVSHISLFSVCMHVCWHTCVMAHIWGSEDNLQGLVLSFHDVASGNWTWVASPYFFLLSFVKAGFLFVALAGSPGICSVDQIGLELRDSFFSQLFFVLFLCVALAVLLVLRVCTITAWQFFLDFVLCLYSHFIIVLY